jgi:hypothetical protein
MRLPTIQAIGAPGSSSTSQATINTSPNNPATAAQLQSQISGLERAQVNPGGTKSRAEIAHEIRQLRIQLRHMNAARRKKAHSERHSGDHGGPAPGGSGSVLNTKA